MASNYSYQALILDLGDVLYTWSRNTTTSLSPSTLRSIISSATWSDFECGRWSQVDCYQRLAEEFSLDAGEIADTFRQARESLEPNNRMISLVRALKAQSQGRLLVFALSNISVPDYEYILTRPIGWTLFDKVYISSLIGERKPDLEIYRRVLADNELDPGRAVFVDDKTENVEAARSLGIRGIVFTDHMEDMQLLWDVFRPPSQRGREFLRLHAGRLESVTADGFIYKENLAQLLILELTGDRTLVQLPDLSGAWNFFQEKPSGCEHVPNDLNTTSLALSILERDPKEVADIMDVMLKHKTFDGTFQTYFDESQHGMDHVVVVNVMTLFYAQSRGRELDKSLHFIHQILLRRGYLGGSPYYASPDIFLYFLGRLLAHSDDPHLAWQLASLLVECVQERIGAEGDPVALAARILVCAQVGVANDIDLQRLLSLQCEDGGWEVAPVYRFGTGKVMIGNRGLSTAFAVKAIEAAHPPPESETVIDQVTEVEASRL